MDKALIEPVLWKLKTTIVNSILEEKGCRDYKDLMASFEISDNYRPLFQYLNDFDDKRKLIWQIIKHWVIQNRKQPPTIHMLIKILKNLGYHKAAGIIFSSIEVGQSRSMMDRLSITNPNQINVPRPNAIEKADKIFKIGNVLLIEGDIGIGKTHFAKQLSTMCDPEKLVWITLSDLNSSIEQICGSLNISKSDTLTNLKTILRRDAEFVVLDFSCFETPMHKEVVATCLKYQSEFFFKLIVTSRTMCKEMFKSEDIIVTIEPFSVAETELYLRQREITDEMFINRCHSFSNGNPLLLQKLVNIYNKKEHNFKIFSNLFDHFDDIQLIESGTISTPAGSSKKIKHYEQMWDWKVCDIVEILVKDETLLNSRRRFAYLLYIPVISIKEFEHVYNRENDIHSYFCNILQKWKSSNGNEATILALANILRENEFVASADSLTTLNNCIPATNLTKFGVKEPVFNFVGREKELKELNKLFEEKKASVILSSAMGGKGKTELCRRFIQQLQNDVETLVTWLSGDGPQQFQQSLSEICQEMNVSTTDPEGKPLSIEKIIDNISKKRKSKWAVIIDNVDEVFTDFYKAIDAFLRNGAFVVVTSRRSDIQTSERIFLEDLEDEDALEFVRSSLKKTPEYLIIDLCKCLQNYPLVLQQAVAYIKLNQGVGDESYGIREYLLELNLYNSQVLNHEIPMTGYEHTILRVFELTLSKIVNLKSLTLLNILSLVEADGIDKEFLKKLFSFFELEELFVSSISSLKSFSLIGVNNGEVSIHRIIQKLTRDRMKSKNNFSLVVNKILENIDIDKLEEKEIIQINQIWENALSESEIIKQNSKLAVKICNRLEKFDLELEGFIEITLQQFVTFLEPDHIDTLRMKFQLGIVLWGKGNREEALVKLEEVLEKYKKVLGEEHEETLECADYIAFVLRRLKRYDESLEWHERVLKSRVKVHGENHEKTMRKKRDMTGLLNEQGKIEEALTIYKQKLESSEKVFVHEDPRTLSARRDIAHCLRRQGKFVEAKKEYEKLLELEVKVLGEDHQDTLHTKEWLSRTLHSLGEKEKALEMMEQLLISQEKVFGPNHWDTNYIRDMISKWRLELGFLKRENILVD